jgi:hypothetical protein
MPIGALAFRLPGVQPQSFPGLFLFILYSVSNFTHGLSKSILAWIICILRKKVCSKREIHYVCDSGRVEGLILHKDEDTEQEEEEEELQGRPINRGQYQPSTSGGGAPGQTYQQRSL